MNLIYRLSPYGHNYHTGHLVLLGPSLGAALDALIASAGPDGVGYLPKKLLGDGAEERFLEHAFPGRRYEYWDMDIPWEERTPELLAVLRDYILAAGLPWEVIDPRLPATLVLAEYEGDC